MKESLFGNGLCASENLCGIDEAGRGPIAGPLVVAGVVLESHIIGADDSKKLTAKRREALYEEIIKHAKYRIVITEASEIDAKGISYALKNSLLEIVTSLQAERYIYDGNCSFGVEKISTLIKADAKIEAVACASILAKVTRDRIMESLAPQYLAYSFKKHKGYGTALHIEEIKKHGLSDIHRKSYKIKSLEELQDGGMRLL